MTKKVVKFYMVWQNDREEKWLREMSLKGWSLQKARLGIYTFEKIEPADYIYKLDYPGAIPNLDEYYSIFQDSGWEPVTRLFGWHYFRVMAENNVATHDIYSDVDSKIKKYHSLSTLLVSITLSLILLFFTVLFPSDSSFVIGLKWLYVVLIVFHLFAIFRLQSKAKRLKEANN